MADAEYTIVTLIDLDVETVRYYLLEGNFRAFDYATMRQLPISDLGGELFKHLRDDHPIELLELLEFIAENKATFNLCRIVTYSLNQAGRDS